MAELSYCEPEGCWVLRLHAGSEAVISLDAFGIGLPLAELYVSAEPDREPCEQRGSDRR
jgi:hypothetical protein